jgi:hypothetical protein
MDNGVDVKLADHHGFKCFEGSLRDPGLFIGVLPFWSELLSFWTLSIVEYCKN